MGSYSRSKSDFVAQIKFVSARGVILTDGEISYILSKFVLCKGELFPEKRETRSSSYMFVPLNRGV